MHCFDSCEKHLLFLDIVRRIIGKMDALCLELIVMYSVYRMMEKVIVFPIIVIVHDWIPYIQLAKN